MRVLRIRTHATDRRAGLVAGAGAGAGATILGIVAALALPVFALKTDPLIVNLPSEAAPSNPPSKQALPDVKEQSGATVLGFAATDYDDTAGGLDGAASNLMSSRHLLKPRYERQTSVFSRTARSFPTDWYVASGT